MLAYYINLIQQQEGGQGEIVEKKARGSDVAEKRGSAESMEKKTPSESSERKAAGREKPAKTLEQIEAERIIATILEKRPGRAEFGKSEDFERKPKSPSPKKPRVEEGMNKAEENRVEEHEIVLSVSSKKSKLPDDLAVAPKASGPSAPPTPRKSLAQIEAERIIATIVPRGRLEEKVEKVVNVEKEERVRRLPPPKQVHQIQPPSRSYQPTTNQPISKPPPVLLSKAPRLTVSVPTSPAAKPKPPPMAQLTRHWGGLIETHTDVPPVVSAFTFHPQQQVGEQKWWKRPIGLQVVEFESELDQLLRQTTTVPPNHSSLPNILGLNLRMQVE